MADSRFHLKVEFEVYGKTFKWSPSLNWSAEPGQCDQRIADWFSDCYEQAYRGFQQAMFDANEASRLKEQEASERATLARLLEKYPEAATPEAAKGGERG